MNPLVHQGTPHLDRFPSMWTIRDGQRYGFALPAVAHVAMHWGMFTEHGVISTHSWQRDSEARSFVVEDVALLGNLLAISSWKMSFSIDLPDIELGNPLEKKH